VWYYQEKLFVFINRLIHIFAARKHWLKIRNKTMQDFNKKGNEEIYSNSIRAGKRTYFFDVRQTRNGELFLTITESKRIMKDEGDFQYEKHKIFLYKEDFEKFANGLTEALDFISNSNGMSSYSPEEKTGHSEAAEDNDLY
jgi:hypothetical protein